MRSLGKRRFWLAASLLVGLAGWPGATPQARADGKVLAPVLVAQEVAMPDQRALLSWHDGVETLVIESAFVGRGTDFAWVVPLPAKPEVEAATRGTLPAVAALMLPVVVPPGGWTLSVVTCGVALAALCLGWWAVAWGLRACVVGCLGVVCGGILSAFVGFPWLTVPAGVFAACWWGRAVIRREASLLSHLIVATIGLLLVAMGIPSFGKVRGMAGNAAEAGGVTVERSIVGDFDVAVLSGGEAGGVVEWLGVHGFALPEQARVAATEHAAGGGWFVASRVRREFAESGRSVPAPLVFRFAAKQPIYPMRFTGAGAKNPLELELFVFGPGRAIAEGLEAVAWGPVRVGDPGANPHRRGTSQPHDARVVTHPEILRLTKGAAVATRLRGTLSPGSMQTDIFPRWETEGPSSQGLVAWAREAAWQMTIETVGMVALLGAIILGFRVGKGKLPWPWTGCIFGAALAAGAAQFARLPSVETKPATGVVPWYRTRQISQMALLTLADLDPAKTSDTKVRELFSQELVKLLAPDGWIMETGDGPGQVELVRLPDGKWRVRFYDAAGQARFEPHDDISVGWNREKVIERDEARAE